MASVWGICVPQLDAVADCASLRLWRPAVERGEMVCNGSEGQKLQSENVQPASSLLYGLMCVGVRHKKERARTMRAMHANARVHSMTSFGETPVDLP